MKLRIAQIGRFLGIGTLSLFTLSALAETPASDNTPSANDTAAATPTETTASTPQPSTEKLPYGAGDVLKLTHAQLSDDVTLNYIQNSGTIYNLSADDIVYLKNEGVSDQVLKAMSDQKKNVPAEAAAENALQAQVASGTYPTPTPDAAMPQPAAPLYVAPIYVQPVPVPVAVPAAPEPAPSTVYVIPDPARGAVAPVYPSGYPRAYGSVSTVYTVNAGYGRPRAYAGMHRHGSSVYVMGRR